MKDLKPLARFQISHAQNHRHLQIRCFHQAWFAAGQGARGVTIHMILNSFLFLILSLNLMGCNYLRTFPLYSEIYTEHADKVQLFDERKWLSNQFYQGSDKQLEVSELKQSVETYLKSNPNTKPKVAEAMRELVFSKGMSQAEVMVVAGKPSSRFFKDNEEIWIYKKDGLFRWYYGWGKLTFRNTLLADIETQYIKIYK